MKVASAGETSEYGDAGADIEESRGRYKGKEEEERKVGVYANIFPARKTEAPVPVSPFARLPTYHIAVPSFPFRRSFCFLSRAFHVDFFLSPPLSLAAYVKKKIKARIGNRCALFIPGRALFSSSLLSSRVAFSGSRFGVIHCALLCLECATNVSDKISKLSISRIQNNKLISEICHIF